MVDTTLFSGKRLNNRIVIQYSPLDDLFIASVPQLEGCVIKEKTPELALLNLDHAIKLYIEYFPECSNLM